MILPTYELYKESAEQANVALEIDIEENITVDADPKHINTVLRNLLSNALKITSGGDSITITAVASDETVRLSVRDTGCGMPKEQLEVLTSQLKNTGTSTLPTTSPNNAGFGLNICKHLLSLHYSELTVVSEQNIGTTLSFELNIAPAPTKI
jgi:two-component system cell cycle sensor histidine kinase PleC